jgi:inosine-uridine nucleoside N-ribohydrolase
MRCIALLAIVGWVLASSAHAAPSPARERVLISTDLATGLAGGWRAGVSDPDDGFAVAMAEVSRRFEILGVIVTFGNDYREPQLAAARLLLHDLMKTRIPVLAGAAVPLSDPPAQWTAGPAAGKGVPEPCLNEGVELMIDQLRKSPEKMTILALGPLTDVACVVLRRPDVVPKIKQVVAIMGRQPGEDFFIGGVKGLTDFNLRRDLRAAKVLLTGSQVPFVFIGFSATKQGLITSQAVERRFGADRSDLSQFFLRAAKAWIVQWRDTWKFKEDGFHPWDQNAVYYRMRPAAYVCDQRGFALIDCTPKPGEKKNACAGHKAGQPLDSQGEHWQLWLSGEYPTRKVTYCYDYASEKALKEFVEASLEVMP